MVTTSDLAELHSTLARAWHRCKRDRAAAAAQRHEEEDSTTSSDDDDDDELEAGGVGSAAHAAVLARLAMELPLTDDDLRPRARDEVTHLQSAARIIADTARCVVLDPM